MVIALLVYDWILCLGKEARFIWGWHARFTATSLVYGFSRYAMLLQYILATTTILPMTDLVRNLTSTSTAEGLTTVVVEVTGGSRLSMWMYVYK